MIAFSVDIDWAPEPVVAYTLDLFQEYGVPCTLFATHQSAVVASCDRRLFEVAIHPNFNPLLAGHAGDAARIVDDLLAMYPDASGVRSHSMTQSTALLDLFVSKGLRYDANHFLPYWPDIRPFRLWNGLVRIPYNWEDDVHFAYGRTFDETGLDTGGDLNVLDFHPVHVFLNTDTAARYEAARAHYDDVDALWRARNAGGPGAGTLLRSLLETRPREAVTLGMLAGQVPA